MTKLYSIITVLAFAALFSGCGRPSDSSSSNTSGSGDAELLAMIQEMSVEEKVGQMTQLNIDVVSVGEIYALEEPHKLDMEKLRHALVEKHVGSLLNVGGHAYQLAHWQEIIRTIQDMAVSESERGIPVIYGIDAIHGANYLMEGTLFPQPLAQAATWNPAKVEEAAAVTAYETRASGIPWNFSPVLDLGRQPLWSRMFETYGEDVLLVKTMGDAAIKGYQGEDPSSPERVSACMKHFYGYSLPFTGKDRTPVYLHERQLREYFLPSFESAIEQGALSVMINSGELNGIPVHADKDVLTGLLRDELGFDGVAVTDWEDIMKLVDNHHVAATLKDAVKMAVLAGVDMSMTPNNYSFTDFLIELVNEGEVPMSRIDEAVYRILLMKKRLGLFENPYSFDDFDYTEVGTEANDQLSYDIAAEAITLLKNEDDVLPIGKDEKVLVTGPGADAMIYLNGAWTRTWQGTDPQYDDNEKMTIKEALEAEFAEVVHVPSGSLTEFDEAGVREIKRKASGVDRIIVCLAELPATEIPGNIDDLRIDQAQADLVDELSTLGVPVVGVLLFNRPRVITHIEPHMDAILMAYNPADEGGRALADILSGDVNPSGKLPITYPRYVNNLMTYDHKYTEEFTPSFSKDAYSPLYKFGHGLSYTTVRYENVELAEDSVSIDGTVDIRFDLVNESDKRAHHEVVLVYVGDRVASITPSVKRLRAFERVSLGLGETKSMEMSIPVSELEFVGKDLEWTQESGWFDVEVGGEQVEFYLEVQ